MKYVRGIVYVLIAVTIWSAAVVIVFEFMMADFSNPSKWWVFARTFFMVVPCVVIGYSVARLQKRFDL